MSVLRILPTLPSKGYYNLSHSLLKSVSLPARKNLTKFYTKQFKSIPVLSHEVFRKHDCMA